MITIPAEDAYPDKTVIRITAWHNIHDRLYTYALLKVVTEDGHALWYRTGFVREPPCPPGMFDGWAHLQTWIAGGDLDIREWAVFQ